MNKRIYRWTSSPARRRQRIKPILDRKHLRGTKYQLAYSLVAAGTLTDDQIALALGVDLTALIEAKSKRYFQERVEALRNAQAYLKGHGLRPVGEILSNHVGRAAKENSRPGDINGTSTRA